MVHRWLAARLSRKCGTSERPTQRSEPVAGRRKLSRRATAIRSLSVAPEPRRSNAKQARIPFLGVRVCNFLCLNCIMLTMWVIYDKITPCENSRMCRQNDWRYHMNYFYGIAFAVILTIAAINLWFKEYVDKGWNKNLTDHRYRIISVIFMAAVVAIFYNLFFK